MTRQWALVPPHDGLTARGPVQSGLRRATSTTGQNGVTYRCNSQRSVAVGFGEVPVEGPLAARHLSAHDVSLDLHRGVGDRDEPRGVSVGVITRGVSARAGLGCQSEVDPGDHDSGR